MKALIAGTIPEGLLAAPAAEPDATLVGAALAEGPPRPIFSLPTPRAAGVAVTGLLAFGVMLGSVVSPAAESQAQSPIVVAVSPPASPAAATAPVEDDSAPADQVAAAAAPLEPAVQPQQQIIYQTVPQSAPPATPTPPPALPIPPPPPLPTVSHVFVVMLSGHGYDAAFGPNSQATYLSKKLTSEGELIPNYYAIAHGELANTVALISGQGPTKQTASNCPQYNDLTPGTPGDQDQATGDGCIYPAATKTLADQLFLGGNTWKAYVEDSRKGQPPTCRHPEIGAADPYHEPRPDDASVTWRNPFLYFHSVIDNAGLCNSSVVDTSQLDTDLAQVGDIPGLSYIVPNRCHDGSDTVCGPDQPTGLAAADAWLQTTIPEIQASPGYKQGGLIAITFDQAPKDGPEADSSSCCGQPDSYPNLPADDPSQQATAAAPADPAAAPAAQASQFGTGTGTSTTPATTAPTTTTPSDTTGTPAPPPVRSTGGGGKVGLLLLSPYVKPNTVNETGYYNHFSLFASIEELFNLSHIGYANLPNLPVFDKTVYTAYNGGASNGDSGDQQVSGASASRRPR